MSKSNQIISALIMIMVVLFLFPNQLFHPSIITKTMDTMAIRPSTIYFIEDPRYYGKRKPTGPLLKLNQLRLAYMYVAHHNYLNLLRSHFKDVVYIPIDKFEENIYKTIKDAYYFDPTDHLLEGSLTNATRLDTPSFILSRADMDAYATDRKGKQLQHNHFYEMVKRKVGILAGVKSMDKFNRTQFSKNVPLPETAYTTVFSSKQEWIDAIEWVSSHHSKNPKPSTWDFEYLIRLPVRTTDAIIWMDDFFKTRFANYGKYQDIIYDKNPLFYHSGLSTYINNGLLLPSDIIKSAQKHSDVGIESYEGFIRQIIGWREYTRYYYHTIPPEVYKENVFNHTITKLPKNWGQSIPIVQKTIAYALDYGYLNHIQRLMVISNFMTLSGYHPDLLYKWMFEFALDSYEWVMIFNCYSMGSYSDNGYAMRKPYISSSKYLLRMSNETKGAWTTEWDNLYQSFIQKQKDVLKHTRLANLLKG